MARGPQYYDNLLKANGEPVEPGSRFPSIAPGHEGQYVSRREHQNEIGEPLGWKKTEVSSAKTGRTRQKWERGSLEKPVTIREVITLLSGAVSKAATKLGKEDCLFLIKTLRADGTYEFAGDIENIEILIRDLKVYQSEGKTLLDFIRYADERYGWRYAPVATGAVQIMVW